MRSQDEDEGFSSRITESLLHCAPRFNRERTRVGNERRESGGVAGREMARTFVVVRWRASDRRASFGIGDGERKKAAQKRGQEPTSTLGGETIATVLLAAGYAAA